jgi:hypothetical protein
MYFVSRQQCKGKQLLRLRGKTLQFYIAYSYRWANNNKKGHIIAYKWQQWLHKLAIILRYTYIFLVFHAVRLNCDRLPLNFKKMKGFVLFHTAAPRQVGRNIHADSTITFITAHICNQTLDYAHIEKVPCLRATVDGT